MRKITKLTRAKRNLIVEEVSKSYSNYKKYQNLATKYAIVNDRTKVFTSYNKIQQEIKKLLTELNGDYKVISLIYSYAFSDLYVNAIYKKPDKIKEMVYLSLGIIIK